MNTISIKYSDIPKWLQTGEFYRSLGSDDPDELITIPIDCFGVDHTLCKNVIELCQLIRVALFWMLDEIPLGALEFCAYNKAELWQNAMLNVPGAEESKILAPLIEVYPLQETIPIKAIIATGKLELIVHCARKIEDKTTATAVAAQEGNLHALKRLHEQGFKWDENSCCRASLNGHLDCLQFAHENGCHWDYKVYEAAAQEGHLHIMKYAHQQGLSEWTVIVCQYAALSGHLDCLQFAHENGCPWDSSAVRNAAQEGHLVCLQYLIEQGCPIDEDACTIACMRNQIHSLEVLRVYDAPWDAKASFHAAVNSDISCLQHLHENGCSWDDRTPNMAVQHGCVNSLRYALDHGCPYDEKLMGIGGGSGSLPGLQYLVEEQGLYMDEVIFINALLKGNLECVQYLIDQGCPYKAASLSFTAPEINQYDKIFVKDNPEFTQCVRYAVERGWTVNYEFCLYARIRDERCLAYLMSEGLHVDMKRK